MRVAYVSAISAVIAAVVAGFASALVSSQSPTSQSAPQSPAPQSQAPQSQNPKPQEPQANITIQSVSWSRTADSEDIILRGTEQNLPNSALIFGIALLGSGKSWVVSAPAALTPGDTWTAEIEIRPPFKGQLSVTAGVPRCPPICAVHSLVDKNYIARAERYLISLGPLGVAPGSAPPEDVSRTQAPSPAHTTVTLGP